jgi:homopolymeric O-antigen transport system ATP-binding protein
LFSTMSDEPVVVLSGVTKAYRLYHSRLAKIVDVIGLPGMGRRRRYDEFEALNGIDLRVHRGERLGIVGRNGAGKTTLLKLVSGVSYPTRGTVEIRGRVQALMSVGLGFHPEFSGLDNIRASLAYNGLEGRALDRATEDVVDFAELGGFLHQPLKTYSLGMQARLMFASATAIQPDTLIVDEVLGAGDAYFAAKCADRMRRLTSSGCTLLLVSHSMQQIIQFCDRVVWLEAGRVVMDGSARGVVGAYEVESARRIHSALPGANGGSGGESQQVEQFGNRPWLASQIDERERTLVQSDVTAFEAMLGDGRRVMRWPSTRGVKIESLRLMRDGVTATAFESGKSLEIEMEIRSEVSGEVTCRYYFSFFSVDGRRAAWVTNSVDRFLAVEGQRRWVRVCLTPLLLGRGNYVLSTSIFDGTDPSEIGRATRYDLLARCLEFTVTDRDARDPAIFHHPAEWEFKTIADPRRDARASTV